MDNECDFVLLLTIYRREVTDKNTVKKLNSLSIYSKVDRYLCELERQTTNR